MLLDIDAIQSKKLAIEAQQNEAVTWCREALGEFGSAARALQTPPRGNPDFLSRVYGDDARPGVWPILREMSDDNILIEIGHGASMTMTGKTWLKGKESPAEDLAWWIAARCHFSVEIMGSLFEAALLGTSWNVRTALNADG